MNNQVIAQKLYDLVYETFETGHFDAFKTSAGAHNQSNEIQFRLMSNLVELKKSKSDNEEIINAILADINVAHALSLISNETHQKFEELLGEL